jgi:hypothetical protein
MPTVPGGLAIFRGTVMEERILKTNIVKNLGADWLCSFSHLLHIHNSGTT